MGGPRLWRMSLLPDETSTPDITASNAQQSTLKAFRAYVLPSVEALIQYFRASAGFPVQNTWLTAIKAGNFYSWPDLTYQNSTKYCPACKETIKVHMVLTRQHVQSTKPTRKHSRPSEPIPKEGDNEIHIKTTHIIKLYNNDTGRFPIISITGNQYIMVEYHCDANAIIDVNFKSRKDKDRMVSYNTIMQRLKDSIC